MSTGKRMKAVYQFLCHGKEMNTSQLSEQIQKMRYPHAQIMKKMGWKGLDPGVATKIWRVTGEMGKH